MHILSLRPTGTPWDPPGGVVQVHGDTLLGPFWTEDVIVPDLLSPTERAEYDRWEEELRDSHPLDDGWVGQPPLKFSSITLAIEYSDTMDRLHGIIWDIDAFGAGGMGLEQRACAAPERRLRELESLAV